MARQSLKNVMRLIDSAKEKKPIEQEFLADLKRSIELTANSSSRIPSRTYKPSGMNCIRANYYQLLGKKPDDEGSNYTIIGICNAGTDIHVRVQTAVAEMKDNGIDCDYLDVEKYVNANDLHWLDVVSHNGMETKLYHHGLNISFMCDGIIRYKGKYYILELKTESSWKFQNRKGVDESHFNQAIAYSLAFNIEDVIFVYISRDILDMKAFMYHVTDEMRVGMVEYIKECDGYVARQIAPPKPENVAKKTCSYCGYKTYCKKDG